MNKKNDDDDDDDVNDTWFNETFKGVSKHWYPELIPCQSWHPGMNGKYW